MQEKANRSLREANEQLTSERQKLQKTQTTLAKARGQIGCGDIRLIDRLIDHVPSVDRRCGTRASQATEGGKRGRRECP